MGIQRILSFNCAIDKDTNHHLRELNQRLGRCHEPSPAHRRQHVQREHYDETSYTGNVQKHAGTLQRECQGEDGKVQRNGLGSAVVDHLRRLAEDTADSHPEEISSTSFRPA